MKNKGQMFIIVAVIMIVVLVILKIGVNIPDIMQKNRESEGKFEHDFFVNVVDELTKTIDVSYYQPINITNNVYSFANFTRKKMTEKLQNFKLLYVGSITPASSGSDTMNVTVINLLNKNTNVTLNMNGTIKTCSNSITYDFTDTTNNKAYNNSVVNEPPNSLSPASETVLGSETSNISSSDDNYFTSSSYDHPYHKFNITINESVSEIDQIAVTWEGHSDSNGTVNLYVYNFTSGSWGPSIVSDSGTSYFTLTKTFTSGFNDIINSGKISVLVQDPDLKNDMEVS